MTPSEPLDVDQIRRDLAAQGDLGLGQVITGPGALDALAGLVSELRRPGGDVVVLAAATPITTGGRDLRAIVEEALGASAAVDWAVLGADGLVYADEPTVAAAASAAAGAGCVITVGSGTVTDIGKAAAPGAAPLIAVQTATSVNGYADPFSVLLRRGVKRTTPSRWPDALIIDPGVLADAPPELNRAGAGDMMAMFTATADWYLASAVRGETPDAGAPDGDRPGDPPYHPAVADLVRSRGPRLLDLAAGLGSGPDDAALAANVGPGPGDAALAAGLGSGPDQGALGELAGLLTLSGIAMGVAGSTAPASGMEHAVSHLLEMAATAAGRPGGADHGNLHGAQVGVAAVVAARTWARVLARIEDGGLDREPALPDPDAVRDLLVKEFSSVDPSGAMAAECFADYARKLRRLAPAGAGTSPLSNLGAAGPAHRRVLEKLLIGPAELTAALRAAGLPTRFRDLADPVDDATARWAVANCARQRQRFGVADLAMLLGAWQDADVDEVLNGDEDGDGDGDEDEDGPP
jgi:glycerol-1-phosphate dehydrogenase [NAD(P)+]